MPSLDDFYSQLTNVNSQLQAIHKLLTTVQAEVSPLDSDIKTVNDSLQSILKNLSALINLTSYTNNVLFHISQQNDTVICDLEKISKNTCENLNEAHIQTGLETAMKDSISDLLEITKSVHPEAALEIERLKRLKAQIEECCPPEIPGPACTYEPCFKPTSIEKPPENKETRG